MLDERRSGTLSMDRVVRPRDGGRAQIPLSRSESRDLLATKNLGRALYTEGAMPAVLPVDYVVADERIYLRVRGATPSAERLPGSIIALEVDTFESHTICGWQVLVTGACVLGAGDPPPAAGVEAHRIRSQALPPWLALDSDASLWSGMRIL